MTNQQLWLSIGIPAFIVLSWFQTNSRLSDFKGEVLRRSEAVETRQNRINTRLDGLILGWIGLGSHLERIDGDLRNFYGTDQKFEGRRDELSARVK